jgi:carboxyl-terminal processing protease
MSPLKNGSKRSEQTSKESKVVYGRPQDAKRLPVGFLSVLGVSLFIIGISIGFIANDVARETDSGIVSAATTEEAQEFLERGEEYNEQSDDGETESAEIEYDQFWEVWDAVQKYHVDQDATDAELFYGALQGMVNSTDDPYSAYFNPEEAQQLTQELENGSFEGIGAEIGRRDGYLVVIAPLPNSPALNAGLRSGDIILKIDEEDATGMSIEYGVFLIRGEKETTVTLQVAREGEDEPLDIAIERNTIEYDSVAWEMIEQDGKKLAYVELRQFNQDASALLQTAINEFLLENPDGVILDLRNNGGGVVEGAIEIASLFVESGNPILIEEFYDGREETYATDGTHPLAEMETVVLVNGGSASASEIVAAALRDYDKAELVGTTTFGKGTVQRLIPLEDDSLLKLTHARWLTSQRAQIEKEGIEPDYVVEREEDDFADEKDTQKDAAIEYFTDQESFQKKVTNNEE